MVRKLIVTPRMHGLHHSFRRPEQHSNWSSGRMVWEWLHGMPRPDVPQDPIMIRVVELCNARTSPSRGW